MRSLVVEAGVAHELHVLDPPDAICKERLSVATNAANTRIKSTRRLIVRFMAYFAPPTPDEGFNVIPHSA